MSALFTTREDLRTRLRDLLVDEVRRGLVEGERAKIIAQEIIDELELAPAEQTPLIIFQRLATKYPAEFASLKSRVDAAHDAEMDQELARAMAELISKGNFDAALAVSRGETVAPGPLPLAPDQPAQNAEITPAASVAPESSLESPVPSLSVPAPTAKAGSFLGTLARRAGAGLISLAEKLDRGPHA